jgi:hypothetical protein
MGRTRELSWMFPALPSSSISEPNEVLDGKASIPLGRANRVIVSSLYCEFVSEWWNGRTRIPCVLDNQ